MDKDRFEHMAAELQALRIMVAALTDLFHDPDLLHSTVSRHAEILTVLPTMTEEQKQHLELVRRKLNTFSHLL